MVSENSESLEDKKMKKTLKRRSCEENFLKIKFFLKMFYYYNPSQYIIKFKKKFKKNCLKNLSR